MRQRLENDTKHDSRAFRLNWLGKKRRSVRLTLAFLVIVGALIALLWPEQPEPTYKNKTLSEWLYLHQRATGYDIVRDSSYNPAVLQESEDAVRAIGTNALPCLLKWIQYDPGDSRWRHKLETIAGKLPGQFGESRPVNWLLADRAFDQARLAQVGFDILGTNAVVALPQLKRLILNRRSSPVARPALVAVRSIGPDGIPILLEVLADSTDPNRATAASLFSCASCLGTNRGIAVRLLSECVGDSNLELATGAAESLGDLAVEPGASALALAGGLQDPRHEVRLVCAASLARIGEPARLAVPALIVALQDENWQVRIAVTNALRKIAPGKLTNSVIP